MEISLRLKKLASMVEKCTTMADIGTDHGYVPIYLVKNHICEDAIATDINKGPIEKAKTNIFNENLQDKIQCRIGGGFSTLYEDEVQCAVIAGMGGNLIRDIIEQDLNIFKKLHSCILQPVQNVEVLREYIYKAGYEIIDEDLCREDDKFYEIIKVRFDNKPANVDPIFWEVSKILIDRNHPLIKEYIEYRIKKYYNINQYIKRNTLNAQARKAEVYNKIKILEELLEKCR